MQADRRPRLPDLDRARDADQDQGSPLYGFDVVEGKVVDMAATGIVDPAAAIETAVRAAVNTAALALTTNVVIHHLKPPVTSPLSPSYARRETAFDTDLAPVLCLALSPDYTRDGCLYAGTAEHGLHRSTDRGESWARVGGGVPPAPSINALLYPAASHILAMLSDALLVSRDGGESWEPWAACPECNEGSGLDLSPGATCVAAPQGLAPGAPLLVGLADGRVLRV